MVLLLRQYIVLYLSLVSYSCLIWVISESVHFDLLEGALLNIVSDAFSHWYSQFQQDNCAYPQVFSDVRYSQVVLNYSSLCTLEDRVVEGLYD